jgi:hypothetical protein
MNNFDLKFIVENSESKATDKLAVLLYGLQPLFQDKDAISRLENFEITWDEQDESLPEISISFRKETSTNYFHAQEIAEKYKLDYNKFCAALDEFLGKK